MRFTKFSTKIKMWNYIRMHISSKCIIKFDWWVKMRMPWIFWIRCKQNTSETKLKQTKTWFWIASILLYYIIISSPRNVFKKNSAFALFCSVFYSSLFYLYRSLSFNEGLIHYRTWFRHILALFSNSKIEGKGKKERKKTERPCNVCLPINSWFI